MNTLTNLAKWNPFNGGDDLGLMPWRPIRDMQSRLDQLFGRWPEREALAVTQWAPLVDIAEDDKEYLVKAELPEVKKEDIKVCVEEGTLSITGERRSEKEEKDKKYHRIERSYGNFLRSFTLPDAADSTKVNAEFKDGVLKVHLPKSEKAKPKSIEVKVS